MVHRFLRNMISLSYVTLLLVLALLWSSCKDSENGHEAAGKPNIIIIVTDDAGYSDYSFMGSSISTPHIDRLASNSFIFTNFYNNGRCSPTRASLMTGHYPQKVGVGELSRPSAETSLPGYLGFLSLAFKTLPELLKLQGYHTIMSGKWHLGGQVESRPDEKMKWPVQRGFHSFFGIIGGTVRTHFKPSDSDRYVYNNEKIPTEVFDEDFYSSDGIMDYIIEGLNENIQRGGKPFFAYLPFFAPHLPLEAPQELVDKYASLYSKFQDFKAIKEVRLAGLKSKGLASREVSANKRLFSNYLSHDRMAHISALATHAAMMENLDMNIGRLIATLKEQGDYDNTLIFLFSDNGVSATGVCDLFNAPYYGRKGMLWEGGIKTPLIVSWPQNSEKMRILPQAWHVMDLMPTVLDILGQQEQLKTLSGRSFRSVLESGRASNNLYLDREFLFWSDKKQSAGINKDGLKWIRDDQMQNYLYDLKTDPTELHNLAADNPLLVREFRSNFIQHKLENNVEAYEVVEKSRLN